MKSLRCGKFKVPMFPRCFAHAAYTNFKIIRNYSGARSQNPEEKHGTDILQEKLLQILTNFIRSCLFLKAGS